MNFSKVLDRTQSKSMARSEVGWNGIPSGLISTKENSAPKPIRQCIGWTDVGEFSHVEITGTEYHSVLLRNT